MVDWVIWILVLGWTVVSADTTPAKAMYGATTETTRRQPNKKASERWDALLTLPTAGVV
jgi:hypothetical protein